MSFIQILDFARRMWLATALAVTFLASAAFAESNGEHREHEAHEHGHGTLDIVVEGEELVIELRVPAVNVVGFEHAPKDDEEREAVRRALLPFADAASVLVVSAQAECEVEEFEAGLSGMEYEDGSEGERHHDHEGHDQEGNRHEAEEHAERGSDPDAEVHSEMRATYRFHCRVPERLDGVDVRVFEHLRDAEEIQVRVVTPTVQLAMELHPGSTVVEFAQ